jgi:ribosome-associated protein YbcJ (S4-like RNA binding protein)
MTKIPLSPGKLHIELCDLLKLAGLCDTGGTAKQEIAAGKVKVGAVSRRDDSSRLRLNFVL